MAVDIRFYDPTTMAEINLDKVIGGRDFGVCKKNTPYVIPVLIKNVGNTNATGLSVKAVPLNSSGEVSTTEYNNQLLASTWKTFSLLPDQDFSTTLLLPNIPTGGTLLGKKKFLDDFTNPQATNWTTDTRSGHKYIWTGSALQLVLDPPGSTSATYCRIDATKYGNNKEIDLTNIFAMPQTTTPGTCFLMWGLRMNSNGDGKGYLINMKRTYNATTGASTVTFEIRKAGGITATGTTDFGTILSTSQAVNWTDYQPIRIKLSTNSSNQVELKIWVNNIKDTDSTVLWGATNPTSSWIDTSSPYLNAGTIAIMPGVGANQPNATFEFRNVSMITDDTQGKVYIRTIVGDGSVDQQVYKSALELSYD